MLAEQVAKDAGLGRESLYKALAPGAKPRFETVVEVTRALGFKFTARAHWIASHALRPNDVLSAGSGAGHVQGEPFMALNAKANLWSTRGQR